MNGKNKTGMYERTRDRYNKWRRTYLHMDVFSIFFARTEVIIGASKAKNCEEFDGNVR